MDKFKARLGVDDELDIYRKLDIDKIAWLGIPYRGVVLKDPNEYQQVNHWGVGFEVVEANENAEYGEVSYHPLLELDSVEELEEYPWPNPDDLGSQTSLLMSPESLGVHISSPEKMVRHDSFVRC